MLRPVMTALFPVTPITRLRIPIFLPPDMIGREWAGAAVRRTEGCLDFSAAFCLLPALCRCGRGSVNFLNRDGQVKSYTVAGYSTFASKDGNGRTHVPDLALGKLSRPIALTDNIGWYPVLNADDSAAPGSDSAQYVGKKIISYGAKARAGINEILSFAFICTNKTQQPDNLTFSAVSDFHPGLSAQFPDETGFAGGDSGGLSFIVWKNRLVLMGTHFAVGADGPIRYNVDAFLPYYLKDIISAMNGSGYSVSTIVVDPEPSSLQFLPL